MVVVSGLIPFESQVVEIIHHRSATTKVHSRWCTVQKKGVENIHGVKSNVLNVVQNMYPKSLSNYSAVSTLLYTLMWAQPTF